MQKSASQSKVGGMGSDPNQPMTQSFDDNAMQQKEHQMKSELIEELRKKLNNVQEEASLLK